MVNAASENPFPITAIPVRTAANSVDESVQQNQYIMSWIINIHHKISGKQGQRQRRNVIKNEGVPVGIILFSPIRDPAIMRDHACPFLRPIQSRVK